MADDVGLEAISSATDLLGIYGVAIDGVILLNQWITQAHDAPDPVVQSLNRVHAALNAIDDAVLGSWLTAREENLAFLRAHSSTTLQTLAAFQESGASLDEDYWAASLALADRDSLIAVQTLTSDMHSGYWLRPYSLKAISMYGNPEWYDTGWMPHIPDRAETYSLNRVWDYRWALPATLYAISTRIVVMRLFGYSRARFRAEVSKYNQFLVDVFRKMESGVRSLKDLSPQQIQNLNTHGVPIAVANIYGGYYIGGLFNPHFIMTDPSWRRYPPPLDQSSFPNNVVNTAVVLSNMRTATNTYESRVKIHYGWEEFLRFIGKLDNFLLE